MYTFKSRLLPIFMLVCLLAGSLGLPASRAHALVIVMYVKQDAPGPTHDGSSWTSAYTDLQSALAAAADGNEIWVAEGTYKPTTGSDRTATFQLKSGVPLYGSFAGTETSISQRNLTTHVTTLSGDIGTSGSSADNAYHVVRANSSGAASLDGFTITGGYANGSSPHDLGGGLLRLGAGTYTLNLKHIIFRDNTASNYGGGIYNGNAGLTVEQVTLENNTAGVNGGGMYNAGNVAITNSTFNGNSAQNGGGLYSNFPANISNSTFYGNHADPGSGGGIYNELTMTVTNITVSHNSAVDKGGGIFNNYGLLDLNNSILANSTLGVDCYNLPGGFGNDYNLIEIYYGCLTSIITADPYLDSLQNNGSFTQTMALLPGSPAIDEANTAICSAADQRGIPRPLDGDSNGSITCDLGAYEFNPSKPTPIAPMPGEMLLHKRPTFKWSNVPFATEYKIQVSENSTFTTLAVNTVVTDLTYTPNIDLWNYSLYYWRVRARVAGVWRDWSLTWIFVTGEPPSVPVLVAPANDALVRNYRPLFDWNNSTLPSGTSFDHYQIQITNDPAFDFILLNESTATGNRTASFFTPSADLDANATYYWRVKAFNTAGHYSAWSAASFRTALTPPVLTAPADDASLLSRRPTLDWGNVTDATGYKLVVSRYLDFSTPLLNIAVTDSIYNDSDWTVDLPANKVIYWRVKATGANPSDWSETWNFTTGRPPSVPVLVSPANDALLQNYKPPLEWNDSTLPTGTDFDHYQIQLASDADFSSILLDEATATGDITASAFTPGADLLANAPYYWRVKAFNTAGHFSAWSAVSSFRTALTPPVLLLPDEEASAVERRPLLDWEDVTGATGYKLVVSRYPDFSTPLLSVNVTDSIYNATDWTFDLPANKLIYWRVKATGANPSGWSGWSFTTVP